MSYSLKEFQIADCGFRVTTVAASLLGSSSGTFVGKLVW